MPSMGFHNTCWLFLTRFSFPLARLLLTLPRAAVLPQALGEADYFSLPAMTEGPGWAAGQRPGRAQAGCSG